MDALSWSYPIIPHYFFFLPLLQPRALRAKLAFLRIAALLEFSPRLIHATVTPPKPCFFHHAVKEPTFDGLIFILLFFSAMVLSYLRNHPISRVAIVTTIPPRVVTIYQKERSLRVSDCSTVFSNLFLSSFNSHSRSTIF